MIQLFEKFWNVHEKMQNESFPEIPVRSDLVFFF